MEFTVDRCEDQPGRLLLRVHGSVDSYTSRHLDELLLKASRQNHKAVVVNLDDVSYIDSTGLEVLLAALRRAQARAVTFTIDCGEGAVRTLFELTGLTTAFGMSAG